MHWQLQRAPPFNQLLASYLLLLCLVFERLLGASLHGLDVTQVVLLQLEKANLVHCLMNYVLLDVVSRTAEKFLFSALKVGIFPYVGHLFDLLTELVHHIFVGVWIA